MFSSGTPTPAPVVASPSSAPVGASPSSAPVGAPVAPNDQKHGGLDISDPVVREQMIDLIHEYLTDMMDLMESMNDTVYAQSAQYTLAKHHNINRNAVKRADDAPVILSSKDWENILNTMSSEELYRIIEEHDPDLPTEAEVALMYSYLKKKTGITKKRRARRRYCRR